MCNYMCTRSKIIIIIISSCFDGYLIRGEESDKKIRK